MARIVVSEHVSLDGVMEDPTGEEGSARGGWFGAMADDDRAAWAAFGLEEALGAQALLLGRRTHDIFAARWPAREGAWADRLNGMPKYVVSSTPVDPPWGEVTVLGGAVAEEVARVRRLPGAEIVIYASGRLVRALMAHDLVDEVRLVVHPVVLGAGAPLFGPADAARRMRLTGARTLGTGLVLLTYETVR